MNNTSKVDFTFGWLAMKLLGKSLYSNPWSAISELVANGFDADADAVYIYIDLRKKENSIIEIFDNGTGMTDEEIHNYVKVGYNKRENPTVKARNPMGRKGIGKLAALYLSNNYSIITKTLDGSSAWQMHYVEEEGKNDEKPFLQEITDDFPIACSKQWGSFQTGTFLKLTGVNLIGKGNAAFDALEQKLSNYFSLDMTKKKIMICPYSGGEIKFHQVRKTVAFGNMAFIEFSNNGKTSLENEYKKLQGKKLEIPYTKPINEKKSFEFIINISEMNNEITQGMYTYPTDEKKEIKKPFTLKGWIGIHSSINKKVAEGNDQNFKKNQFYNPNQLRLYVRNKLAIENFLNVINNTQAFVNYIEGEISFDILDDDDLPDIATSNRQSMDEHDRRIEMLIGIVEAVIQNLITKRNKLADKVKKEQEELITTYNKTAKQQFSQELEREVENLNMSEDDKVDFVRTVSNKISGDMVKSDYAVFLSHARKNKTFTDFLYYLLLKRGAETEEFFYTSSELNSKDFEDITDLGQRIKKSIINTNTLLFYLTSKDYKQNQFCMFEGGAGWATRSVGEYIIWTFNYEDIPIFLTNKKLEFVVKKELDKDIYNILVSTLNRIIEHLNGGRKLREKELINPFDRNPNFPDAVELKRDGKSDIDYMDPLIVEYWETYVSSE